MTNPWHHLLRGGVALYETSLGVLVSPMGGTTVVCMALCDYLLVIGGAIILVQTSLRMGKRFRTHSIVLIIAAVSQRS